MSAVSENSSRSYSGAMRRLREWDWSLGAIAVLVILHVVGAVGLQTASHDWFLSLTPVNLLISAVLVMAFHKGNPAKLAAIFAITALAGFFVEVAGVKSGVIFGEYAYGETLGPKALEVPFTIGLNWFVLVYATGMITRGWRVPLVLRAAVSALLMVLLDIFLEPVAIQLDFWSWTDGVPPLQNYAAWFGLAFLLGLVLQSLKFEKGNKVAVTLFIIQMLFFGTLNLIA